MSVIRSTSSGSIWNCTKLSLMRWGVTDLGITIHNYYKHKLCIAWHHTQCTLTSISTLHAPVKEHLTRSLFVLFSYLNNLQKHRCHESCEVLSPQGWMTYRGVVDGRVLTLARVGEGAIGSERNAILVAEFQELFLGEKRMNFHLVDSRLNLAILQELFQHGNSKVGHT